VLPPRGFLGSSPCRRPERAEGTAESGGDSTKKQTVKCTTLPPVAPAPDVFDAPLGDDIAAANVFDDMPNRYEIVFCRFF
jgi:hypothetical protein